MYLRRIDSYLHPDRRSKRIIPLYGVLSVCETRAEGDNGVSASRTLAVIVSDTLCIRVATRASMHVSGV